MIILAQEYALTELFARVQAGERADDIKDEIARRYGLEPGSLDKQKGTSSAGPH